MASVAYTGETTIAPFRNLYAGIAKGELLSDEVFATPKPKSEAELKASERAIALKVVNLPDRVRFDRAVTQWLQDIKFDSFPDDMKEHESFANIIAQGYGVVPLIAANLRKSPSFLFLALEEIFEEDPVPEQAYGKLSTVTAAWLEWLRT